MKAFLIVSLTSSIVWAAEPQPANAPAPADQASIEARVFYEEGLRLMVAGEHERAIEVFDQVIIRYPGSEYARAAAEKKKELEVQRQVRRRDRQGFFMGFGVGAGGIVSQDLEDMGFSLEGVAFDLRIGGGLSDRFLLMGEVMALMAPQELDSQLIATHFVAAAQYFLVQGFFVRAGFGIANATLDTPLGEARSDVGFALVSVLGYELRFGEMFAVSIEAGVLYARTSDYQSVTPEGHVGFTWYW